MYANKYWNFGDAVYWARYVYKYEARTAFRKCCFECYHDSTCDYFVDAHSHCFYGRFSYTGSQLGREYKECANSQLLGIFSKQT